MSENTQSSSLSPHFSRSLFLFSLILTALAVLLILAGGLVTSHEAGLAVPDWPLSYGQFFPPMVGNIFWEHGHRMIAGTVGILTLGLAVWIQAKENRPWLKRLAWAAFGLVIFQALLGGLGVLHLLPAAISITHAVVAQMFLCLVIAVTYYLRPGCRGAPTCAPVGPRADTRHQTIGGQARAGPYNKGIRRLLFMTTIFIYLQLILGATSRHTSFTIIPHVVTAFLVAIHVAMSISRIMQSDVGAGLKPALALGFLTVVQFFLGIGAFVYTRMLERGYAPSLPEVLLTASHQTLGALILALSFLLTLIVWR